MTPSHLEMPGSAGSVVVQLVALYLVVMPVIRFSLLRSIAHWQRRD